VGGLKYGDSTLSAEWLVDYMPLDLRTIVTRSSSEEGSYLRLVSINYRPRVIKKKKKVTYFSDARRWAG